MTWVIDKQFEFCYGHRVWSQQLEAEFCETGDVNCKCRFLHGHEGLVHVFLEGDELTRGMVTDFKHLGWLKNFINSNIDHKFMVDINDPYFEKIINGKLVRGLDGQLVSLHIKLDDNTHKVLPLIAVYVPETSHLAGYNLDVAQLEGCDREFYEGFFLVNFLPTSENLSKWIFDCVSVKMQRLGVKVSQIDWFETPKSRSSYRG